MEKENLINWNSDISFWKTAFPPEKIWLFVKLGFWIVFLTIVRQAFIMSVR